MEREAMEYDVVIVGAGPAGLSAAIRLKQLNPELAVMVLEKGSEVGAHILSGALFESRALDELLPDWQARGAPLKTPVSEDQVLSLSQRDLGRQIARLCRSRRRCTTPATTSSASAAFAAGLPSRPKPWGSKSSRALPRPKCSTTTTVRSRVWRPATWGRDKHGEPKDTFQPGLELHAKYTLLAEGSRGQLGKELIARYDLAAGATAQHYGLGIKELWQIDPAKHRPGLVVHGAGWPLSEHGATGGSFLYHLEDCQVAVGLIADLNYANPYLSPFEEFQRFKLQAEIRQVLSKAASACATGRGRSPRGASTACRRQTFPAACCSAATPARSISPRSRASTRR
jgi:electron-transferring-flavoprotein dehydrogenase